MQNSKKTKATANSLSTITTDYLKGTFLDIYSSFDTDIHPGKFFTHLYNEICFSYTVVVNLELEVFLKALTEKYTISSDSYILRDEQANLKKFTKPDYNSSSYLIQLKSKLIIEVHPYRIAFWYGREIDFAEIESVIELVNKAKKQRKFKKNFFMIIRSQRSEYGFELKKFRTKDVSLNIEENYNDDFVRVNQVVTEFLNEDNKNGLILLHGKHGTGKTTYIRHLLSTINKQFVFLPLELMESISGPGFLPFISKHRNSIIVLEDCEDLLAPRGNGNQSSSSLVNLLNLGDGLLADALSFKIICTFNANLKQIDQAILRKGRLVARYEFKDLEVSKVDKLFEKLGIEEKAEKPLSLAEIFNKNAIDFSELNPTKKIGF